MTTSNEELINLLRDLIKIPSWVSENGQNENDLVDFLEGWLIENTDYQIERQLLPGNRYNLIVKKGKPDIVFLAHTDTVQPSINAPHDQLKGTIVDGKMWGRGTTDMKSGIAAMIQALAMSKRDNVWMFLYADEEYNFLGMKELIKAFGDIRPTIIISSDGSDLQIGHGCRGLIEFRGRFIGKTGHAAKGNGISAISNGYKALNELEEYIKQTVHPVMGKSSFNIAYVLGGAQLNHAQTEPTKNVGQAGNVIPDVMEFVLDIRPSNPDLKLDVVINKLIDISRTYQLKFDVIEKTHDLGAWFTELSALNAIMSIAENVLERPVITDKPEESGYIDLQMLWETTHRPISFMFGGGVGSTAHTPDEHIELENLIKERDFFLSVLENY